MNSIFVSNNMAKAKTLTLFQTAVLLARQVTLPVVWALTFILPQGDDQHHGVKVFLPSLYIFPA
ncbi:MAG: hypothetical protein ABI475_11235 [Methylophilaceae bacterium]